jgi:guanylate kinase
MNPIIALVGSSGVGKTSLILAALKEFPDCLAPIRVLTTRARRGSEDDVFCRFVDAKEIQRRRDAGSLVQYLEYAGNVYGCDREDIDGGIQRGCGIQAYVETGIFDLRKAGYSVVVVHILGEGAPEPEAKRKVADEKRAEISLTYDKVIVNSFTPGGFERAAQELQEFIRERCPSCATSSSPVQSPAI